MRGTFMCDISEQEMSYISVILIHPTLKLELFVCLWLVHVKRLGLD